MRAARWLALAGCAWRPARARAPISTPSRACRRRRRRAADGGDSTTPVTCPSPALPPGDSMQTVQVGGVSRSYVLHVPPAYDGSKPVPLVVDFHGLAGSGRAAARTRPIPTRPIRRAS